jgi:4-carboxymuconolactone decarboxylase
MTFNLVQRITNEATTHRRHEESRTNDQFYAIDVLVLRCNTEKSQVHSKTMLKRGGTMSRVQDLKPEELSLGQRRLFDEIAGPRHGNVRGPFAIWLRTPVIADHANKFGNALRIDGRLDKRLFELMVLVVARNWTAQYEWFAHERNALEAALAPDIIAAIKEDRTPMFAQENERVVFDVTKELLETKFLSDATYKRAVNALGLDLLIELITSIGFYTMVAMMTNAFEIPVPGGTIPLAPPSAR